MRARYQLKSNKTGEPLKFACYCQKYLLEEDKIVIEGALTWAAESEKKYVWSYYDLVEFHGYSKPVSVFSPPSRLGDTISII